MRRAPLLAAALLLATSCRSLHPDVPLATGDPRPAALLAAWEAREGARQGLRGIARLAVDAEKGVRIRARQILVLERPGRLRVEILGFMNQVVGVLATDGQTFQLWDASDGSVTSGRVTPSLLWETAYLAVAPEVATDLLLGVLPPQQGLAPGRSVVPSEGGVRVELVDARGAVRRSVQFDEEGRLRELTERDAQGAVVWRARYGAYADVGGTPFAHSIELEVTRGGTRAEIELHDVELNPALDPDMFRLRMPGIAGAP